MSKKHSLALGCLLLAVLAAAYFLVSGFARKAAEKEEQEEASGVIPFTDCPEPVSLSYDSNGTSIAFEKDESGTWKYTKDPAFPALQATVQTLANDLGDISAKRDLGEAEDLSVYGLDTPSATFSVSGEDSETTVITIGNETDNGDYYATKSGDSHVYTISDILMNYSDYTLYDWLEVDKIPSVFTADVKEFKIDTGSDSFHYIRTGKDEEGNFIWYKDSDQSEENRVEDVSIPNHLATAITNLSIYDCADYSVPDSELSQYGLDSPSAVIWYSYTSQDSEEAESTTDAASETDAKDASIESSETSPSASKESDGGQENASENAVMEFSIEVGNLDESGEYYYVRPSGSSAVDRIEKSLIDDCLTLPSSSGGSETP